ncbi:hypothetical protein B296_00048910 [Ensete ventricosum]|uniref:Uncharacterized protein n=1 Tax=Ensete ventricosum TaxID=4639 RepID=A0A426YST9_ENSVE|nr:hypothetical protein B296_00048910 [Ensete ventricosum]
MSLGYAQKLSYREDIGTVGMSEIFDPPDLLQQKVVAADEGGETKVGEAEGEGKGELDHHVIGTVGGGAREDEVGDSGDEDSQEEEERPKDHYVPRVRLVDTHPPEIGLEAFELVVSVGEAACV